MEKDSSRDDPEPLHVFDQTNGLLKRFDAQVDPNATAKKKARTTRSGSEANTAAAAHATITGAQGGF